MEREQKLIRAILRRGSKAAADELVRSYYDEIYRFIYRQVGNREDALDLVQECFISALSSLQSYEPQKAGFRTWLYHLVTYKIIDMRRKKRLMFLPLEEAESASGGDFTDQVQNRELLKEVESFVCGVDTAVQEVFRLRVYADCSFPEIAKITAQPEAKAKARYYRLAAVLRKEFGEDGKI